MITYSVQASEDSNKNFFYAGLSFGPCSIFNLELPTPGKHDGGLTLGAEAGTVFNKIFLIGVLYSYSSDLYISGKDYSGKKNDTELILQELSVITTWYPFSDKPEKPYGLYIRVGVGGAKFIYDSSHPEYNYNDLKPDYGMALIAGVGYSFDLCSLGSYKAGIDLSRQKYMNPGNIDDTEAVKIYLLACDFFY